MGFYIIFWYFFREKKRVRGKTCGCVCVFIWCSQRIYIKAYFIFIHFQFLFSSVFWYTLQLFHCTFDYIFSLRSMNNDDDNDDLVLIIIVCMMRKCLNFHINELEHSRNYLTTFSNETNILVYDVNFVSVCVCVWKIPKWKQINVGILHKFQKCLI